MTRLAKLGESYRKAFDAVGIDKVRRLTGNATLAGEKLEQALLWIGEKDAEQQRALAASVEIKMAEQIRLRMQRGSPPSARPLLQSLPS